MGMTQEAIRELVKVEVERQLRYHADTTGHVVVQAAPSPRELRERAGVELEVVAERAGVCAATVRRIEAGRFRRFSYRVVWKIADALGIDQTLYANAVKVEQARCQG